MPSIQDVLAYPIEINDQPYHVDVSTWTGRDVTDFSPRASVPGTGIVYADLTSYQPIAMLNWQHGFGFIWHEDEAGYKETNGYIDTRHKNAVMLFTEPTSGDTDANIKEGGVNFNDQVYFWGDGGIRKYDGSLFSDVEVQTPWIGQAPQTSGDETSENTGSAVADAGTLTLAQIDVNSDVANATMLAVVAIDNGTNVTDVTATHNSIAMTDLGTSPAGTAPQVWAFYLNNPVDAKNVVFTFSISSGTVNVVGGAVCLYGLDTSAPFDTVTETTGTGTDTGTIDATSEARDFMITVLAKVGLESDNLAASTDLGTLHWQHEETSGSGTHIGLSYKSNPASDDDNMKLEWDNSRAFAAMTFAVQPQSEGKVNYMLENGEYIFAFPDSNRVLKSTDGSTWTLAGNNHNSTDYKWAVIHNGYVWAGKDSSPYVYFGSEDDLSDLQGDPDDDTDEIQVGPGSDSTLGAESFLEKLSVSRADGLWTIDTEDNNIAKTTISFRNEKNLTNFRDIGIHGGNLYFPVRDKLYQWNGARLTDITPDWLSDSWEYTKYGRFDNFMAYDRWMFFTARDNASTYSEVIIAHDGVGMHKLVTPISDGDGSITMLHFDPDNNYIWYHVSKTTASTETTYYVPVNSNNELPYASFPTSGTNQLITSRIHAGFRRITKSAPILLIEADNCTTTRYIRVKYRRDGDTSWSTWADVTTNGLFQLELPAGAISVEFKYIELAFEFVTNSATETPVLEGAVLMVLLRPGVKYGYSFDILARNEQESGMMRDLRTAIEVKEDLRTARSSEGPIELITPFGETIYGYITALTERILQADREDIVGGSPNIVMAIRVNFIEVLELEGVESIASSELLEDV